jgi:hypothetical protein
MASLSRRAAFTLPAAVVTAAPAAAHLSAAQNPDHDLLSLCRRHARLRHRMQWLQTRHDQAWDAHNQELAQRLLDMMIRWVPYGHKLEWEASQIVAQTRESLRVKARMALAKVEFMSDGTPDFDDCLLWSVCRDLLGGGTASQARR